MKKYTATIFLIASIVLFIIAMTLQDGWRLLLGGWVYIKDGYLTWLANPLIILAWIFFRKTWFSLVLSVLAIIFNSMYFFYSITDEHLRDWLWLSSMAVMLAGNIIRLIQSYKAAANRK